MAQSHPSDISISAPLLGSARQESASAFALWMLQALGIQHRVDAGICEVLLQEDESLDWGEPNVKFALDASNEHRAGNADDALTVDAHLLQWLCEKSRARPSPQSARPQSDPRSVFEVSRRLFDAYQVENGQVHMGGCSLEGQPFLRLTYTTPADRATVNQVFISPEGTAATREQIDQLELAFTQPLNTAPTRLETSQFHLLVDAGRRIVDGGRGDSQDHAHQRCEPLAMAVVWVNRADGKLQFTIHEHTEDLPFHGWARTLTPPPFVCPHSGMETFAIAITDDGRIAAAEAIGQCSKSHKRVLASDLVTCSTSGQQVLPEYAVRCPISGKPTLSEQCHQCGQCKQQVSGAVLQDGTCDGCRALAPVSTDDPRMVCVLGEFPRLEIFKRWSLAETDSLYILLASRIWRQILFVLEKDTLAVKYAATKGRLRRQWQTLDPAEQQDLFRSK